MSASTETAKTDEPSLTKAAIDLKICNIMMKGMTQDHGPGTPRKKSPETKD